MNEIREEVDALIVSRDAINRGIASIQDVCPHAISVYSAHGSTGNWDRDDSFWYNHYCYDCRKRWTTDQKYENKSALKVDTIDYDKKPEIIELELKIEAMR